MTPTVVIGAGLYGMATAHALVRRGRDVILLDGRGLGRGDSGVTFGMVRRHYTNSVLIDLATAGSRTLMHWDEEIGVGTSGFVETGYLLPVADRFVDACRRNVERGRARGVDSRFVEPDEIAAIEPLLSLDGIVGAAYEPQGGYANVHAILTSLFAHATQRGLVARLGSRVRGIRVTGDRVVGVDTDDGPIETSQVVAATGAWTRDLVAPLGIDLPIELRRLQVSVLRQPPGGPRPTAVTSDSVTNVVVRPADGNEFLCVAYHPLALVEDRDDCDEGVDASYEPLVRAALAERYPTLAAAEWRGGFAGTYDPTPDWHPLVGPAPGIDGLTICCGWSGHGFKSAPAVGRCIAAMLAGDEPEVDLAPLALDRFARGAELPCAYGPGARA